MALYDIYLGFTYMNKYYLNVCLLPSQPLHCIPCSENTKGIIPSRFSKILPSSWCEKTMQENMRPNSKYCIMLCVTDYKFRKREISMMTRVDQRWLYEGGGMCDLKRKVKIRSCRKKGNFSSPLLQGQRHILVKL